MGFLDEDYNEWRDRQLTPVVQTISAAGSAVLDCRGMRTITLIPTGSGTFTYSYVDSATAGAHDSDSTSATISVLTIMDVAWPYVRVEAAVEDLRVCVSG